MRRVAVVRRNLLADWRRLAAGVLAVGLAFMLMLLLNGLWDGVKTQATIYVDHVGADLFVTQKGVANFVGETSTIPRSTVAQVRGTPGVEWAAPARGQFVVFELHGRKVASYLVGYVPGQPGGPWELTDGRRPTHRDEVALDRVLAQRHGLDLGDRLAVGGRSFRVVGLAGDASAVMTGFVFVTHDTADALLRSAGTTSYVLVGTDTPSAVRLRLARQDLTVLTRAELAANDRELMAGIYGGPMSLMVGIAVAAGVLVVALTVYASVSDRRREYGVLKALGADRRRVTGIVVRQALVLSAVGLATGTLLFVGARELLGELRPQFAVQLSARGIGLGAIAAIVIGLLAAIVPARRLAAQEPAAVYRSW
jgi:putative ABC transport system permease protein